MLRPTRLALSLAAGLLASQAGQAAAARNLLYQMGYEIFEAGPLPDPYRSNQRLIGVKAGYRCHVFGLLWAYLSISDCEAVAFRGHIHDRNPELVAAIKKAYPTESSIKVSLWNKHGRWVLAVVVVAILLGIAALPRSKKLRR